MSWRRRRNPMPGWISRDRSGAVVVNLQQSERDTLRSLLEELRELLLRGDSDALRRLYPTAYPQHAELERDYRAMIHDTLLAQRLDTIDAMQATLDRATLTDDELTTWMHAVNAIRLTLGTLLDVGEDDALPAADDPDAAQHVLYHLLGLLLEQIVAVMFDTVPEDGTDDDPFER